MTAPQGASSSVAHTDFTQVISRFIASLVHRFRKLANFGRALTAHDFPDTPLPDSSAPFVVLLGSVDLLSHIIDHLGEGEALCDLAATCRTFRKAVVTQRQHWIEAADGGCCSGT